MGRILAALVVVTLTSSAQADVAKARDLYQRATRAYNLQRFAQALELFQNAYNEKDDPVFLFNIGQCQRQLGQKQEAVLSYRAYLRESPNPPNRDEVQGLITNLEKAIHQDEAARNGPPPGTLRPGETPKEEATRQATPVPTEKESPALTKAAPPPAPERTPLYKKWWLWTIVGVVVVGAGVGLGVGLSGGGTHYPSQQFSDGTVRF